MRADLRHIIMKRMQNDSRDMNDFADMADRNDMGNDMAYQKGYDRGYNDGRRGVRGSGRGRRDRADGNMDEFDDEEDFGKPLRLPKKAREKLLKNLTDKHGNKGPRFGKEEVMKVAENMNVDFDDFTPSDLYVVTNMRYSDCTVFRPLVPPEKEIYYAVSAAVEWLEDVDSNLKGSEKLVSYYYNVVNG